MRKTTLITIFVRLPISKFKVYATKSYNFTRYGLNQIRPQKYSLQIIKTTVKLIFKCKSGFRANFELTWYSTRSSKFWNDNEKLFLVFHYHHQFFLHLFYINIKHGINIDWTNFCLFPA